LQKLEGIKLRASCFAAYLTGCQT